MPFDNPSEAELQEFWDEAIARYRAGGEHPLARHPNAVRCDGAKDCWTVAPIRDLSLPNPYAKRYCFEHLPKRV